MGLPSHSPNGLDDAGTLRWYEGISRYQWLVLTIASLGWIFDVFEGQIFVASMQEAMPSLAPGATAGRITFYNNVALAAFSLGGAAGGILFGMLSDRVGRKRTLSLTILFYSVFTCLSAFSQAWWHLAALRFFVAVGVGGEWAVASALVAETFPMRARAQVGSIFHASSVLGSYLATAAGAFLIGNEAVHAWARTDGANLFGDFVDPASLPWRMGFALGLLPALLVAWIRTSLREPESWRASKSRGADGVDQRASSIAELFRGAYLRPTLVGIALTSVGMATFWGVHIYGKNMLMAAVEREHTGSGTANSSLIPADSPMAATQLASERATALKRWEMRGMFLVTTGGGLGLLAFGPICARIGRRPTFLAFHLGGLAMALVVFQAVRSVAGLVVALPAFGFATLGMHAGYAIYFPELYPTRLRGAGAGLCFNAGRMLAAPMLLAVGWLQDRWGYTLPGAASLLSLLFLVGAAALAFAPETKGRELPA